MTDNKSAQLIKCELQVVLFKKKELQCYLIGIKITLCCFKYLGVALSFYNLCNISVLYFKYGYFRRMPNITNKMWFVRVLIAIMIENKTLSSML